VKTADIPREASFEATVLVATIAPGELTSDQGTSDGKDNAGEDCEKSNGGMPPPSGTTGHPRRATLRRRWQRPRLNRPPQSMPKTADSSPAVLPKAGPATATVRARIDLNGAFA
jgi:hypothetical protein